MPQLADARHHRVGVDGLTLHVAELGPVDGPPLLLVHGWPQNWWCWSRVAPLLADRYRLLMPDLRGHGWSDAPDGGYDKETIAADLLGLLDAMELPRVGWLGHDWGAWAGFLAGMRAPERLAGLLALSVPHPWPSPRECFDPLRLLRLSYQLPLSAPVVGRALMRRGLTRQVLTRAGSGFSERDLEIYEGTMGSPRGARTTVALYRTFLLREAPAIARGRYRGRRFEPPALLLVGERDPVASPVAGQAPPPNAPQLEIEGVDAGHFLPQECAQLVAERARTAFGAWGLS